MKKLLITPSQLYMMGNALQADSALGHPAKPRGRGRPPGKGRGRPPAKKPSAPRQQSTIAPAHVQVDKFVGLKVDRWWSEVSQLQAFICSSLVQVHFLRMSTRNLLGHIEFLGWQVPCRWSGADPALRLLRAFIQIVRNLV